MLKRDCICFLLNNEFDVIGTIVEVYLGEENC